ncbi:hypothetical protein NE237_028021 [Protea cynaroides]|uniref:Uncharacterized protein n=1 Tax=Protea cynaroides TaxID=273540 RepID=A0A9Q0GSZ7_9MAGN|nr:hypothetical protein NE237_028021 [Protea cynaroides]
MLNKIVIYHQRNDQKKAGNIRRRKKERGFYPVWCCRFFSAAVSTQVDIERKKNGDVALLWFKHDVRSDDHPALSLLHSVRLLFLFTSSITGSVPVSLMRCWNCYLGFGRFKIVVEVLGVGSSICTWCEHGIGLGLFAVIVAGHWPALVDFIGLINTVDLVAYSFSKMRNKVCAVFVEAGEQIRNRTLVCENKRNMVDGSMNSSGLVVSNNETIRSFLRSVSKDPNLSDDLRETALNLMSESSVTYKSLRLLWFASPSTTRPKLLHLFSGSDFVFSSPKPREKSEELKVRLKKLEDLAERNAYKELVKDITPRVDNEEPFSSYKDQLGFGLHVALTMFTGFLVGYATFRALFNSSPVMNAAGGILGLDFDLRRLRLLCLSP